MGAVIVAIASSVPLGVSAGVLVAAWSHGGIRPCRRLREQRLLARCAGACVAVVSGGSAAFAASHVSYQRAALAGTCIAVALLAGFVSWLFLVERDDDDPTDAPAEPEWWPAFERELEAWSRNNRVPSGVR